MSLNKDLPPNLFEFGIFQIGKTYVPKNGKISSAKKSRNKKGTLSE